MDCNASCVYYKDRGKNSICHFCSDYVVEHSRFELKKVDPFKLAKLLAEKKAWETLPQWLKEGKLGICPDCQHIPLSLWYNRYTQELECFYLNCKHTFTLNVYREYLRQLEDI